LLFGDADANFHLLINDMKETTRKATSYPEQTGGEEPNDECDYCRRQDEKKDFGDEHYYKCL